MKKYFIIIVVPIIILIIAPLSIIYAEGEASKNAQKATQTVEKKIEQGHQKVEAAATKASEKIEPKIQEAHDRTERAVTHAHEKAMKRAAWLRTRAVQMQEEAERIEARVNAAIKREKERLEKNMRKVKKNN
jgi:biopolymer transport protein ExbB/TolQ